MRIGLLGDTFNSKLENGLVTGYGIASSDLTKGFLKYSVAEEIFCIYEPKVFPEEVPEEVVGMLNSQISKKIHLVSEYDILFHGEKQLPKIDILHSVREDAIKMLSLREMTKQNIPLTFTVHSLNEQHLIMDFFYPLAHLPFQPYDAIICTSASVKSAIERILDRLNKIGFGKPSHYQIHLEKIPLGIDVDYFRPLDQKFCRQKYGIPQNAFVIMWLGRFSDIYKADLYPLIYVFGNLVRNNPCKNLQLILAGSYDRKPSYADKLINLIKDGNIKNRIRIIYSEEIENRAELYSACDIFTSPVDNLQESFGLTPIEAMSCGVPQVVSDWDGYRDTVKDGETGFLIQTSWAECMEDIACMDFFPSNTNNRRLLQQYLSTRSIAIDCEMYKERLQLLINQPETCRKMGIESRKRAVKHYSISNIIKRTDELWGNLLEIAKKTKTDFSVPHVPRLDYCHDFSSHPAKFIRDNQEFTLTKNNSSEIFYHFPHYDIFESFIEEGKLLNKLMEYIQKKKYFCIDELLYNFPDYTKSQIRRTVLHLYKYDFIKLKQ